MHNEYKALIEDYLRSGGTITRVKRGNRSETAPYGMELAVLDRHDIRDIKPNTNDTFR